MKLVLIILLTIVVLISGVLIGCNGEKPPESKDMVDYIRNVWKVAATSDEIIQVLSMDDPQSFLPFKSEIGGILTVISMKNDMDDGEYGKATRKGTAWLVPLFLKETSFSWLSPYVSLGLAAPEIVEWTFNEIDEKCFNVQVAYYLCYKSHGESDDEIRKYWVIPPVSSQHSAWLANPSQLYPDCKLPPFPMAPAFTGQFTLEDVFRVGREIEKAQKAEQYRTRDEAAIRGSFISVLEQVRQGKESPTFSPTPEPEPKLSHPWPMSGQNAQKTYCSPYMGPESPNTRLLLEFDEPGLSGCLVSADGTVYINRHTSDAMSIIAIKPNGSHKEIVQSRGVGGLGAIGPGGTLYIMLWEENKGAILVLDAEGTELWRRSLPLCPYKLTWSKNILIGADGTIYASCGDRGNEASSLTVFSPDGTERWSLQDVHSYLAVAEDGTVYSVMEEGKVCAYDGQGEKKWEYDGCNDWSRYYDRVNYSIAIGPDGTVFILPNMLGIQDAPASRLIALTPTLKKAWHVDIPVNINSEYEAVYGPAIAPDGSLYILEGNNLFKISPDGKLELFAEGDFCPKGPIVDAAGIVYVSESTYANGEQLKDTSQVIALNPDGSEKWCTAPLDFEIWLDAVGADGNFFIWPDAIGADGTIYARGEYWVNGQGVFQPIITIGES